MKPATRSINTGIEQSQRTLRNGCAQEPLVEAVSHALRHGRRIDDRVFDALLPLRCELASFGHWTPLAVAQRVAAWLDEFGVRVLLDIGAGPGKFCVAAALASHCDFVGIEQRLHLVRAARSLSTACGVRDRVRFIHGTLGQCSLPEVDAYYLYNPFGENRFEPNEHLDRVELSQERYLRDIALTQSLLKQARAGTYVFKYNGFGGRMPPGYDQVCLDREMPNVLRGWRKTRAIQDTSSSTQ